MDVVISGRIVDNFLMYPKSSDTYGDVWIDDGAEGFGLFDRLENEISGKPGVKTDWTVKKPYWAVCYGSKRGVVGTVFYQRAVYIERM